MPQTGNFQRVFWRFLIYVFLIGTAVFCVIPFYSMLIASTHSNAEIASELLLLPGNQFPVNYQHLVDSVPIFRGFLNSVIISVSATALNLYFSALAGYGFSKYQFKGRNFLFAFVLATMMIPGQLGIIGFFKLINAMQMINTYWPIILPSIANAFGIFFMKQFADASIPTEIVESGRLDGCGEWRIFHRLVIPLITPAIATLGIFSFIGKWNDFLTPMIVLFNNNLQPIPVMIAGLKSQFSSDFGAQYVGILISVVPILVVFTLASKKIISGITAGALKG